MDSPQPSSARALGTRDRSPPSSFRRIVLKTALLNAVIVLTAFPVLVRAGGPRAVVPTLALMAGISILIWTATFTLFSFVSVIRLVWMAFSIRARRKPLVQAPRVGIADRWLDGPV